MTLAEAQALECNGCGDCCDSRRRSGDVTGWRWGALREDQTALVLPLYEAHPGGPYERHPDRSPRAVGVYVAEFECRALVRHGDSASCAVWPTAPRTCRDWPLWGVYADRVRAEVASAGWSWVRPPSERCTWYGVAIVDEGWRAEG